MNAVTRIDKTTATLTDTPIAPRFKVYTHKHLNQIPQLKNLTEQQRFEMDVVASVLPFRVNEYVINELIDWSDIPNDPIFQLTFPQRGMLTEAHFERMANQLKNHPDDKIGTKNLIHELRHELNPHPAGQQSMNVPMLDGQALAGMQHKYRETVLFFPSQGQTCHSYCTFCFRWAQFIGDKALRFSSKESNALHQYLKQHQEVSDLLITGGDPMVMKTNHLKAYLEPLMHSDFDHIQNIRIGTKSLTFWPHRYTSDADSEDLLWLLERLVKAGKHVALMAHYNHWRELETDVSKQAIQRLRDIGVTIRGQAPLLAHINDDATVWSRLWETQVKLGIIPYYMFVERDTGAHHYFKVPLEKAWHIYRDAIQNVSGLARTARGPSMSAGPGKVEVQGITEIQGEKVFALRFIQGRNPEWVQKPFFAKFDPEATWLDDLRPALGEEKFFYTDEYANMAAI